LFIFVSSYKLPNGNQQLFVSTYTNPHRANEKDSFHNPIFALDKKIAVWLALLYGLKKESMKKIETLAQES